MSNSVHCWDIFRDTVEYLYPKATQARKVAVKNEADRDATGKGLDLQRRGSQAKFVRFGDKQHLSQWMDPVKRAQSRGMKKTQ